MTAPATPTSSGTGRPVPPAFLRLERLTRHFGSRAAVDRVTLDVAAGEFVSLLGPSGCGKTTTLHMIAGFLEPDGGEIALDGRSLRNVPSHQRGAAMVFQNYALFPHLSVFDNVAFGLRMAGSGRAETRRRVGEVLELVRLPGLERRWPRELSGGQQQRVALARALVLEPRLLLLDEPLSNLDATLRRTLRQEFVDIHRRTGMTTLLVTHDLEEAFATSDRIAVLGHGRLQQFDTPHAIYTRPRTRFVADFMGHANVLSGSRRFDDGGRPMLHAGSLRIALPPPRVDIQPDPGTAGERHYALPSHGVRLQLAAESGAAGGPAGNQFPARLLALDYLGSIVRYELDVHGLRLRGERQPGRWAAGLHSGAAVQVSWAPEDMIELPAS